MNPPPAPVPPAAPRALLPPLRAGVAVVVSLLVLAAALFSRALAGGPGFDTDQYALPALNNAASRFDESMWHNTGQTGINLQMYAASRLGVSSVEGFRIVAAAIALAAAAVMVRTAVRERVVPRGAAPLLVAVLLLNEPFMHWGTYGPFMYAEFLASGALAWWWMLRWRRTRFHGGLAEAVLTPAALVLSVYVYIGSALPLAVAGLLALGHALAADRGGGSPTRPRPAWGRASLYAASLAIAAPAVYALASHKELREPRRGIHHLLFSRQNGGNAGGLAAVPGFLVEHTGWWIRSALQPVEGFGLLFWPMVLALLVGLIGCLARRGTPAAATAWFVLLNAAGMAVLAIRPGTPFGSVRYGLFVQLAILVTAAAGLGILAARTRAAFARDERATAPPASAPPARARPRRSWLLLAAVVLLGVVLSARWLGQAAEHRAAFERVVAMVERTRGWPTVSDSLAHYAMLYIGESAQHAASVVPKNLVRPGDAADDAGAVQVAALEALGDPPRLRTLSRFQNVEPVARPGGEGPRVGYENHPVVDAWVNDRYRPVERESVPSLNVTLWERK
ncbi:hypothetical protein [Phycisphaera mikurensis]|uniref:Uncharacterized protein n=1 Tax=Phycisphaera mikurensis (strain NBRC 102666 / KCTC 22515 / FYK2301M01) TaxID=1142394 RepID=I0IBE9_PHYMF|nr:hypothetical protein [Phycisphaera mikurensis]MBB6442880.1 hypothetical protein [Phycisphaera mikurensis]BAM02587.1 hypothetical protein PSMK_04280 [Phycisphaera mikurensis NBRC 102666]